MLNKNILNFSQEYFIIILSVNKIDEISLPKPFFNN